MNEVRSLIQFVSRNFYPKQYILVLDALLVHSVLSEDDLSHLVGIQRKELRAICNKLTEDRLIVIHAQREEEGNQQRLRTKTYYYIHFTEAVDSIKWKIHSVVKALKDEMKKDANPEGYVCPRCQTKYSQIDALSLLSDDRSKFICDVCSTELVEDNSGAKAKQRQKKLEKLMQQIDPIITYLKKIDDSHIEDNTFESSLTRAIPAQSSSSASYAVSNKTVMNSSNNNNYLLNGQFANNKSKYDSKSTNAILNVRISNEDEDLLQQQKDMDLKKEKLRQNAMPSWHSESTVGQKSLGRLDDDEKEEIENNKELTEDFENVMDVADNSNNSNDNNNNNEASTPSVLKPDSTPGSAMDVDTSFTADSSEFSSTLSNKEARDALADYYAQLAARESQEEEDEEEDEDDDDDEDDADGDAAAADGEDDEFEDVIGDEVDNAGDQKSAENAPPESISNDVEIEEFDGEESDEE